MAKKLNILILADRPEWQSQELRAAIAKQGGQSLCLSLSDLAFSSGLANSDHLPAATHTSPGLYFPAEFYEHFLSLEALDGVLVRGVAAGSFEQITLRLSILHALHHLGVRVINTPRAIECCVDKAMTSFLLHQARVPTPHFWAGENRDALQAYRRSPNSSADLVIKPLFGAMGKNLRRIGTDAELPDAAQYNGVWYAQEFIRNGVSSPDSKGCFHDYRVLVAGGEVLAAMRREHHNWITNVAQGGQCHPLGDADDLAELSRLALAASQAVGAEFCGVDVICDRNGKYWVLEVNSMAAWHGLQSVIKHNLAGKIIEILFHR
ncbi:MAG: alpha-L-glutamate ligase [Alphaproteobacteria bacterium]|nr:alpha-L-glutamate ligase [Alphaproteobacteria bacterium]